MTSFTSFWYKHHKHIFPTIRYSTPLETRQSLYESLSRAGKIPPRRIEGLTATYNPFDFISGNGILQSGHHGSITEGISYTQRIAFWIHTIDISTYMFPLFVYILLYLYIMFFIFFHTFTIFYIHILISLFTFIFLSISIFSEVITCCYSFVFQTFYYFYYQCFFITLFLC